MKYNFFLLLSLLVTISSYAQKQVQWSYATKKIDSKTYELHITAKLQKGWNIYSQQSPEGGALATAVSFNKNPLVSLEGSVKEEGKLIKKFEELFGVEVQYYKDEVRFVQRIKLKSAAKTNITGVVKYMVCNTEECTPPLEQKFSVAL